MTATLTPDDVARWIRRNPAEGVKLARSLLRRETYAVLLTRDEFVKELRGWHPFDILFSLGDYYGATFSQDDDYYLEDPDHDPPVLGIKEKDLGRELPGILEDYGLLERIADDTVEIPAGTRRAMARAGAGKTASKSAKRPSAGTRTASAKRKAPKRATGRPGAKRKTTGARP